MKSGRVKKAVANAIEKEGKNCLKSNCRVLNGKKTKMFNSVNRVCFSKIAVRVGSLSGGGGGSPLVCVECQSRRCGQQR